MKIMSKSLSFNKYILFCFSCVFVTACGYRCGSESCSGFEDQGVEERPTIEIPYVKGDLDGSLTGAIIKYVTRSGAYEYRSNTASYVLNVCNLEIDETDIGFRYDRKKHGKLTRDTIPIEERITATAEVSVVQTASGVVILGPEIITVSVDYDHDYYFSRDKVNVFSLGQLTDLEEAYDAVQVPLHNELAKAIAEFLSSGM